MAKTLKAKKDDLEIDLMSAKSKTTESPKTEIKTYKTTKDIKISESIVEQVLGQEEGVKVIKKAALQRRHVLLIGEPGTGKSMLGMALAELLPTTNLTDVVSFANPNDEQSPLIREIPAGEGRRLVMASRMKANNFFSGKNWIVFLIIIVAMFISIWGWNYYLTNYGATVAAIMSVGFSIGILIFIGLFVMSFSLAKRGGMGGGQQLNVPRVIVDNADKKQAPFFDASGAHAGALLGDILHDPFQSGGLGTPAHDRVVSGMIHKANRGVLFVDEIANLNPATQQELLTALQEKKHSITGQSDRSAGAMVRTEPVPCDFVMVAAGNIDTIKNMHPALRSRIRGYGYEIYMNTEFKDTPENRFRIAQFVAQEVKKDKKIPHFSKEAVDLIIQEAKKRANRKGHLTLKLRELGGLIRGAGDIAKEMGDELVEAKHIKLVQKTVRTLEEQMADRIVERKKEYEIIITTGERVGRVNGLAVIGESAHSGIILPIEAAVTPGGKKAEFIATGKLGEIAKEAITNVSAIIKKYFGTDIKETVDVYVQFLQTYEGVEGDSASIAVATAVISALKDIPVKQEIAMTGSLSVLGEVLPIGGINSKIQAAFDAGIKKVIVPKSNMQDIVLDANILNAVKIIPVETIGEVLREALSYKGKNKEIDKIV